MAYRRAILYREARFEKKNGRIRRGDWNLVNTTEGAGWEPVYMESRILDSFPAVVDLDDDINRIDRIVLDWDARDPTKRDSGGFELIGGQSLSTGWLLSFTDDGNPYA